MAETRDMANKILEVATKPRYLIPFIGMVTLGLLYMGHDISKRRLEKQYNSLPERIKPYDTNKNGTLELDEINKLEQEILRNK